MDDYLKKIKASAWKECEDILDQDNFNTIFDRIAKAVVKHSKDHPAHKTVSAPTGNKITIAQTKRAPTAYAQHKAAWFEENNYDKDDEIPHPDGTGEVFKRNEYFNKFIWGKMSDSEKKALNDKYGVTESKTKSPNKKDSTTLNPLQVFDKRHRTLFPGSKVEGLTSPDGAKIGLYRAIQIVWKEINENHPEIQKLYKKFSEETKSGEKTVDNLDELPHIPKDVFTKMDFQKIKLVQ